MSGWIPVMQNVHANRKVIAAAKLITGGDIDAMVGKLIRLWSWALDNAESGDLSRISDHELCRVMSITTKPYRRVRVALIEAGLLDETYPPTYPPTSGQPTPQPIPQPTPQTRPNLTLIHDWDEYVGRLMDRRQRDRERKRNLRQESRKTAHSRKVSAGQSADIPKDAAEGNFTHVGQKRPQDSPRNVQPYRDSESDRDHRYDGSLREPLASAPANGKATPPRVGEETELERLRRIEANVQDEAVKAAITRKIKHLEALDPELARLRSLDVAP